MRRILTILLLLMVVLAFGCNQTTDNNNNNTTDELKLADYYPVLEDTKYFYKGDGNEFAEYSTFVDYTLEDRFQVKVDNPGTSLAKIYELKDGVLKELYTQGETYYREDYLRNPSLISDFTENILLQEPLVKGNSWTLADGNKREITGIDVKVTVPYGEFNAIEVTTIDSNGTTKDYYAKDVGLVQSKYITGTDEISSSLEKVVNDMPYTSQVRFYYPNLDKDKYYYIVANVEFNTNDITRQVLESAYKAKYTDGMKNLNIGNVLTTNTKINSLYLDKYATVHIDLSGAFISEMSAGSYYETMLLHSIVSTFGSYYSADKVIPTIDGDNYSSGHIYLQNGEYLKADYSKAIKLN
ncbi:MAG: GerMN domain-containing protein [Firmicutes bacterium]|nr:GerMN domain-containing protein [Bacillota bacterium]